MGDTLCCSEDATPAGIVNTQRQPPSSAERMLAMSYIPDSDLSDVSQQELALVDSPPSTDVEPPDKPPPTQTKRISLFPPSSAPSLVDAPSDAEQTLDALLSLPLSDDDALLLSDPSTYFLPTHKHQRFLLTRDLRKMGISSLSTQCGTSSLRALSKRCILKHYALLTALFRTYCHIGGDKHWLTEHGWTALLRDAHLIQNDKPKHKSQNSDSTMGEIFARTYAHHRAHSHSAKQSDKSKHSVQLSTLYGDESFFDKDPWTGIWLKDCDIDGVLQPPKDSDIDKDVDDLALSPSTEQYKLRKIGDLRMVGVLKVGSDAMSKADITGASKRNNAKKARLELAFRSRRKTVTSNSVRVWKCELIPPRSIVERIGLNVKWTRSAKDSASTQNGTLKLFKYADLEDDDTDLPSAKYVGLSRHEFFDALLLCAEDAQSAHRPRGSTGDRASLHRALDTMVNEHLRAYVAEGMAELSELFVGKGKGDEPKTPMSPGMADNASADDNENVSDDFVCLRGELSAKTKGVIGRFNAQLMRLFRKYAELDKSKLHGVEETLGEGEWCAMALELCEAAKRSDDAIWDKGGRPSYEDMVQCFRMSVGGGEVGFVEFQRCLVFFAGAVLRRQPNVRYKEVPVRERLEMVLKWCQKVDATKTRGNLKRVKSLKLRSMSSAKSWKEAASTPTPKSAQTPK